MPVSDDVRPIIIKRKIAAAADDHHGGAWKVAYADFVTAMMAFFLLMWLLNATSEDQRKGLADYFNPDLPISRTSAGGAGMLNGPTIFSDEPTSGSEETGVPPRPTHQEPGPQLGDKTAVPDGPAGEHPAHGGTGAAEEAETALDAAVESAGEDVAGASGGATGDVAGEAKPDTGADNTAFAAGGETGIERAVDATVPDAGLTGEQDGGPDAEQAEQARLEAVGREIEEALSHAEDGGLEQHFFLRITPEGLVIEIIDADDAPLFASASATPAPILPVLMDVLVPVLDETTNGIAVVGHTDAVPFGSAEYSNWELSADRANSARRLMAARGLPEERIARVTGKAAVEPLVADRNAAQNRRIAITLLRNRTR